MACTCLRTVSIAGSQLLPETSGRLAGMAGASGSVRVACVLLMSELVSFLLLMFSRRLPGHHVHVSLPFLHVANKKTTKRLMARGLKEA